VERRSADPVARAGRLFAAAPFVYFWHKADVTTAHSAMSAFGAKRTLFGRALISAFDPKRTLTELPFHHRAALSK
jgi:hypothetical protein